MPTIDKEALKAKYREERDKRLRPDGNAQFKELKGTYGEFDQDPYADPDFSRDPISEETDAVAIVVSEETATISFAHDGEMERRLDPDTLRLRLRDAFERKRAAAASRVVVTPAEHRLDI